MSWIAASAAAAAPSVISGITGLIQKNKAKKLREQNVRPVYQRPVEADTALSSIQTILRGITNQ